MDRSRNRDGSTLQRRFEYGVNTPSHKRPPNRQPARRLELGAGFSAPQRRNSASSGGQDPESPRKSQLSVGSSADSDGAHLALSTGEHRRVPNSSRFDRADTDVGTERRVAVPRLVSSAAGREQRRLRTPGPYVSKRDRKRELCSDSGRTDGIRPRRCAPSLIGFRRATGHACRPVPAPFSISLVCARS